MVGSPPHVRVIQVEEVEEVVSDRITPACAGNTLGAFSLIIAI